MEATSPIQGPPDFITATKLLFNDSSATVSTDVAALEDMLVKQFLFKEFTAASPGSRSFRHRAATVSSGDLLITAMASTPFYVVNSAQEGRAWINLLTDGSGTYTFGDTRITLSAEAPIVAAPCIDQSLCTSDIAGVTFSYDIARMKQTAAAMGGLGFSERRFSADFTERIKQLGRAGTRSRQLSQVLGKTLSLFDATNADSILATHLALDDLVYRTAALILCPELDRALYSEVVRDVDGKQRQLNELLEWMRANLHRRITLTELCQRSAYSARALQEAFKGRFGCGPIQWIRRQRLEAARALLLHPEPEDSVQTIAERMGYSRLSTFSRDFKEYFGVTPSELLRQGRQWIG